MKYMGYEVIACDWCVEPKYKMDPKVVENLPEPFRTEMLQWCKDFFGVRELMLTAWDGVRKQNCIFMSHAAHDRLLKVVAANGSSPNQQGMTT